MRRPRPSTRAPRGIFCFKPVSARMQRLAIGGGFESFGRDKIAEFFVHFTDDALQVRFAAFAVAAEEANLPRVHDARNVVALLQQKTTKRVDKNWQVNSRCRNMVTI